MKRKVLFMVAAVALLMAACSTDSKVLPKKPVITGQPLSSTCVQDDPVVLTVSATAKDKKAKLSYQWYSNTKNSAKGGTKVAGATGALVSGVEGGDFSPPTDTIGVVYYYVEVTSTLGKEKAKTTSDVAVITVIDQADMPVISASNGDPTATGGGDDIVLTVTLPDSIEELIESGDYEVSYQWYSNPRNSNSGGTLIPNATQDSYMPDTLVEGTTYYYVVITVKSKETGEVVKTLTSNPMRVTVITNTVTNDGIKAPDPFINTHPRSAKYYIGLPVTPLTVKATIKELEGTPYTLTYQWYSNTTNSYEEGEPIEDATGSLENGVEGGDFTPPTNVEGTTYYYVTVTNTIQDNGDGGEKTSKPTYSTRAKIEVERGINAQKPNITIHPVDGFYTRNASATPLSVTATSPDNGTLSYQWYKNNANSNVGGDLITAATNETYTPPTDVKSLFYYYVEVTNTIPQNNDGGTKTASVKSNPACIGIEIAPLYMGGLTAVSRPYNGTTTATWTGAVTGVSGTGISLVQGTAEFAQADVGEDIPVTLIGWYLTGANKDSYFLYVQTGLKANITKAAGEVVSIPTVDVKTNNSITVNAVTTTTGQSVEYAISTASNGSGLSAWQDGTFFNGLHAATNYYIYAHSVANSNYNEGTNSMSAVITTDNPKVYFVTNGGTMVEPITVIKGQALPQPAYTVTTRDDNYTFDYWYTDVALATPYNFDNAINDNFNLYAKWVADAEITMMRDSKEMEWIKGGTFTMGYNRNVVDGTEHRVTLSGFWMGKYEVTQEQWTAVMGSNPSVFQEYVAGEIGTPGRLPVECVSWYEALVFCNNLSIQEGLTPVYEIYGSTSPSVWGSVPLSSNVNWNAVVMVPNSTGYRLPTEAQWEYAARSGSSTQVYMYNIGATINPVDSAWFNTNSGAKTHKVGQKPFGIINGVTAGSPWGLYDMAGNVLEWVWDRHAAYSGAAEVNPTGSASGASRILRGGSYTQPGDQLRLTWRDACNLPGVHLAIRSQNIGLRIVRP